MCGGAEGMCMSVAVGGRVRCEDGQKRGVCESRVGRMGVCLTVLKQHKQKETENKLLLLL